MCDALKTKAAFLFLFQILLSSSLKITYQLLEEQLPPVILGNLLDDLKINSSLKSNISVNFFPIQQPGFKFFQIEDFCFKVIKRIDREELCKPSTSLSKHNEICVCYENDADCFIKFMVLQAPYDATMNIHEISLRIINTNDNPPVFLPDVFTLYISEAARTKTIFNIPKSRDHDNIVEDIVRYKLEPMSETFHLLYQNGSLNIELVKYLDREIIPLYDMKVLAMDGDNELSNTGILKLTIFVEDINDCSPQFLDNDTITLSLPESNVRDQIIYVVQAIDFDKGRNSLIYYSLNESEQDGVLEYFSINPISGAISIKKELDRETLSRYLLIVLAKDSGSPPKTSSMTLNIIVTDVNDNLPYIKIDPVLFILENKPINSVLTTFTVEDYDEGKNSEVTCELLSKDVFPIFTLKFLFYQFSIYTYKITTNFIFDRERKTFYDVIIRCHDNGITSLSTETKVLVLIDDENDWAPRFTNAHNFTSIFLMENILFSGPIFEFHAIDSDIEENGRLHFSIENPNFMHIFLLNSTSGFLFAKTYFDYELVQSYRLIIKVQDSGKISMHSTIEFLIHILNENDNAPEIINLGNNRIFIPENITINSCIFQFQVIDRDDENDTKPSDAFLVNNENHFMIMGMNLITTGYFNRELKDKYHLTIISRDKKNHQLSNIYIVEIIVEDINDCVPIFIFPSKSSAPLEISNDVSIGFTIAQISAHDEDKGQNAKLTYKLHNYNKYFIIDPISGYLNVNGDLNAIKTHQITLNISASDHGHPPLISFTSTFINISRNSLLKKISHRFDLFLQKSSFIIIFIVFLIIILLILIGIVCIVKIFIRPSSRNLNFNPCPTNNHNVYCGPFVIIDRAHLASERTFQDSVLKNEEESVSHTTCLMTTF